MEKQRYYFFSEHSYYSELTVEPSIFFPCGFLFSFPSCYFPFLQAF